jgi:uncharacterized membrane protein YphA (DoxX/SURF4 family)
MKFKNILFWIARIVTALILLQTLFFKFTGSAESVYIFTTVGMEPWGRIGIGVMELIAGVLLLVNRTAWLGAGLALGLMIGAIGMHLTLLGIEVMDDGGQLFIYAIIVAAASVYILVMSEETISEFMKRIKNILTKDD